MTHCSKQELQMITEQMNKTTKSPRIANQSYHLIMRKEGSTLPTISENTIVARPSPIETARDEKLDSSPLWNKEEEGWELTWPIWHMLPRDERKALANKHGYKTIGAFEE